jgi:hypothetical protein
MIPWPIASLVSKSSFLFRCSGLTLHSQISDGGLAEMAWRDNPDADGVAWSSVRDSAARAMLLFGDRLGPADFFVESVRLVETDPTLLDELNETAARCGSFIAR